MPLYEYCCTNCKHQLEELQKFSDEPLTLCPQCNQSTLGKQVSATSFQLKGSGWYVTDFSNKGKIKPVENDQTITTPSPTDKSSSSSETPVKNEAQSS